jgi:hypothetical protein
MQHPLVQNLPKRKSASIHRICPQDRWRIECLWGAPAGLPPYAETLCGYCRAELAPSKLAVDPKIITDIWCRVRLVQRLRTGF